MVKRVIVFIVGTFLIATGVNFIINSNLGVSPISLLPYAVSLAFPAFSFGVYTIIVNLIYYLVQLIMLGKDFPKLQHGQIFLGFIFGVFIDLTNFILDINNNTVIMQVFNFIVGGFLIASGILLLFIANVSYSNAEGMIKVVAEKYSYKFGTVKIVTDALHVILAFVILLSFYDKIIGIGIGTLLLTILIGPLIDFLEPTYTKVIMRYING